MKFTTSLLVLALGVGCKKKQSDAPTPGSAAAGSDVIGSAHAGSAQAATSTACPDEAALEKLVREHRKLAAGTTVQVDCAEGRFGEPGWHISATVEQDDEVTQHQGILSAGGTRELVPFTSDEIPPGAVDSMHTGYEVHDLDGDGIDELIESFSSDKGGYIIESFSVLRLDGKALKRVDGKPVSYDNSAAEDTVASCDGERAVVAVDKGKHIVVTVENVSGKPAATDCLPAGKHAFALQGDKLVPVK